MRRTDELLKLAAGLRTVPQRAFDMAHWCNGMPLRTDVDTFDCGFVGCAMGWFPRFVPENGLVRPGRGPRYQGYHTYDAIAAYFDITLADAEHLFSPQAYGDDDEDDNSQSTVPPSAVADHIEAFIKKKEVSP